MVVVDLTFFFSDRIGELELEPRDLGLLDPSGLEAASEDFLEEKNRPLNTIFWWGRNWLGFRHSECQVPPGREKRS